MREDWDLYICHLLVQVREFKDDPDNDKVLIEKRHHIESVLFKASAPDDAYDRAVELMSVHSDSDHDGEYDLREFECIGIFNLDNTQISTASLGDEVSNEYGFTVDCIDIEDINIETYKGKPSKSRLKLFMAD